jgi:SAM-dependent methyltransferase
MDSSEWAGRVGDVWAEEWRRTDRSFAPLDAALVSTVCDRIGGDREPRILDVGCGAGTTSLALADRLPGARITGIDLSAPLLSVARSRAVAVPGCRFEQGDASSWAAETGFDHIVSRHGVMFFADPVAAFAHLRGLTRPDGGLTFSCFRSAALNPWASALTHLMPQPGGDPHAPGPFAFADKGHVQDILTRAGWRDVSAIAFDFDYVAGEGDDPVADAVSFFQRIGPVARAMRDLTELTRGELSEALLALVRDHVQGDRVQFPAAAWIWSASA